MHLLLVLALLMPTILDSSGRPFASRDGWSNQHRQHYAAKFHRNLRAKYDAAQTTDENERHWANADYLSANAALRPGIRKRIRARARYEALENNSIAKGLLLTLANDLVGTGPRLQLMTPDRQANLRVERAFDTWAREVRLAEKLRTMRVAKCADGETFGLLGSNFGLTHDVKLDLFPVEADQFDPFWNEIAKPEDEEVDGIRFDAYGNPTSYWMLKEHPGSQMSFHPADGKWIPASQVIHLFRQDRPGQRRGVSEIVTALPLFAMLRRFSLATLSAAEVAADLSGILHTNAGADVETAEMDEDGWFESIPIEYRALLTLPQGWTISQMRAEHPSTTYAMFKREIINEISRCLNMPYNVAAADSSDYNYASGRMDHQVYYRSIAVEQHHWECAVLDRLLYAWLDEATLIPGLLPEVGGRFVDWQWQWFWDSPGHVDPQKEANAQATRIASGTSHRAREYQRAGLDIDTEDEAAAASYGVTVDEYRAALFKKHHGSSVAEASPDTSDDEDLDEDEKANTKQTARA